MEEMVAQVDNIIQFYEDGMHKIQDQILILSGVLKQLKNLRTSLLENHSIPLANGISVDGDFGSRSARSSSTTFPGRSIQSTQGLGLNNVEPGVKPQPNYTKVPVKSPLGALRNEPKVEEGPLAGYINIRLGEFIEVSLAYVSSSRHFVIQPDYSKIEAFYQTMNKFYYDNKDMGKLTLPPNQIKIGEIVCMFYQEDESFYRVKVLSREGPIIKGYFVDFGEMTSASAVNFYKLDPQFAQEPIMALNCYLNEPWTDNFSKIDAILLEVVDKSGKKVEAKFEKPVGTSFPVSLRVDGQELKSIRLNGDIPELIKQIQFDFTPYASNKSIKVNDITTYYQKLSKHYDYSQIRDFSNPVSVRVVDLSNFVVSFDKSGISTDHTLNNFVTNLSLFYALRQSTTNIRIDDIVVFKFENFYFRGLVLGKTESEVSVFAVDMGFPTSVPNSNVFELLELFNFQNIPPLSVLCGMHRLVPIKGTNWSQFAISYFKNFMKDTFSMEKKAYNDGKFFVTVSGNKDIITNLKKQKFAKEED